MIAVIDYGSGNTGSILNILNRVGAEARLVSDSTSISEADGLVLPGVGSFDNVVDSLERSKLLPAIQASVFERKRPLLGICVGMQMLFDSSEEGVKPGLGWIPGHVTKFRFESVPEAPSLKVPHMGWKHLNYHNDTLLFEDLEADSRFYFVHSYYVECDAKYRLADAEHGSPFCCAVQKDNVYGVQFHPEKSHRFGMKLFKNFAEKICCQ